MAFFICQLHGGNTPELVCSHILQGVSDGNRISDTVVVEAEYDGSPVWAVRLCRPCAEHYGYRRSIVTLHGDDGLDEIFNIEEHCPVCALCLQTCIDRTQ